jgi:hypothetical protein
MSKKSFVITLIVFLLINLFATNAQNKILVLNNKETVSSATIELLNIKAKSYNFEFIFSKFPEKRLLENSVAVGFWNFDESQLSLEQNNLLLQYFKNSGGVIAFPGNLKNDYKWIWFENFFGKKITQDSNIFSGDLISFFSTDHTFPSPTFKISNAYFEKSNTNNAKPYIIDFQNNTLAYIKISEFGNKLFYFGFEPDILLLNIVDFEKSIFGGIENIINSNSKSKDLEINLPKISQFKSDTLRSFDFDPKFFVKATENQYFILNSLGRLFKYDIETNVLKEIGNNSQLKDIDGFSVDSDFENNSYMYYFKKTSEDKSLVKRVKVDSTLTFDDFEQISTLPKPNVLELKVNVDQIFKYNLPDFYKNKTLSINASGNIMVTEFGNREVVVNQEPFILNQDSVIAISTAFDQRLLVLTKQQLLKIQYDSLGHFEPQVRFEYFFKKNPKYTNLTLVAYSNIDSEYEWSIENKIYKGKEVKVVLKPLRSVLITLKAKTIHDKEKSVTQTIMLK